MTAPEVNELFERWWPLARGIARKWGERCAPWLTDEFESFAGEALWKLARDKGDTSTRFAGLVRLGVRWAILRVLKREHRRNPVAFENRPAMIDPETGMPLSLVDLASVAPDDHAGTEAAEELLALFDRAELPERHREILLRRVGKDEDRDAVAAAEGCSPERITQITGRALARLRAAAEAVADPAVTSNPTP